MMKISLYTLSDILNIELPTENFPQSDT